MRFLCVLLFITTLVFSENAQKLKDVTLQLQWKSTFEFAGFYVAKEKGYYKDIGLNVNVKEWKHGVNVVEDLVKNKANYGVLRPSSLIDISNGKDIIYLLALYQSNPLVLLADKKSGIKNLKDIKHKKIMATKDHLQDAAIVSLFSSQNIQLSKQNIIKHSFNVKDLLNGKTDLMVSYISNEPFLLKEAGGEPVIINSKDYGFDFYNDILSVNKAYLKNNSDEVEKFKQATIKGFEYAFTHIKETIDLIYNKHNTLHKTKKALIHEAKELKKLAYYETDKIGTISKDKLEKIYYIYKLLGLIKNNINTNGIIHKDISSSIKLTNEEKEYLQNKNCVKACADPDWLPFDKIDKKGNYIGISADYLKLVEKFLSTKIKLVKTSSWQETLEFAKKRKCDIIASAMSTPNRKKYLNFTEPYVKFPLVVATRMEVPFINNVKDLYGKKVGTVKGYAVAEVAKEKFPLVEIVYIDNIKDGLEKVNNGELFAVIDTMPSIAYNIQTNQSQNIKISGKVYTDSEYKIAVRNDDKILLNVVQKAINNITAEQKQKIFNKWISVKYENGVNYDLIKKIVGISLTLLIIMFFWNRKVNSVNTLLKIAQKEIEEKNQKLDLLASTDKLTRIYNRLKLDTILEEEVTRSKRYRGMFGVCILDIDFFKKINDTYGHQAGDATLQELAGILKYLIRKTDYVGRWGGEEFMIICIEIGNDGLFSLVEKIRQHIKAYNFSHIGKMTVSIGISTYRHNDSVESIVKRADDALYQAKESGRDKSIII